MSKVNGIFICLHSCNSEMSPYYNTLEYDERLCLADCFDGGRPPSSNTYSIINQDKIERSFNGINAQKKLFFTESNSAHHISYFIAKRVFEQLRKEEVAPQKYLVVNFDQHQDYGSMRGEFFCGSWGCRVTGSIQADYFIIGEKTKIDSHLYHSDPKEKTLAYDSSKDSDLENILSKINEYDKIYVTVDMDVLTFSDNMIQRTNWKQGKLQLEILNNLLSKLPNEKIVAADITGFPPKQMLSGSLVPIAKKGVLDSYIQDIQTVAQVLCNKMSIPYIID